MPVDPSALSPDRRLEVLFEEYRAVYALVSLRLSSLEGRAGLSAAAFTAFLTGFTGLDPDGQRALIVGLPIAMLWLLRTTIAHCRSFEDAVRRIEQIESRVNALAGETLLGFQSQHPSRSRSGGRTGRESVAAVCLSLLGICAGGVVLAWRQELYTEFELVVFGGSIGVIVIAAAVSIVGLKRYRYQTSTEGSCDH